MQPKSPKLLEDIRDAAAFILAATGDMSLEAFLGNRMVHQAVERNFEIIGEAMNRLYKVDPHTAGRVGNHPQIISFRNILIHGYDEIDRDIVWGVIRRDLPGLKSKVENLLREA